MGNNKKQPKNKGEKDIETLASRAEKTIKEMAAILATLPRTKPMAFKLYEYAV